jgi:hypothetical protein
MDVVTVVLVVFLLVFLLGGVAWPRPSAGGAPINTLLYFLAVVVIIVVVLRLLGVLI